MMPSEYNETLSAPESSRNTHFQITPAALAGMAHGKSIPARKNPLPKKGSLRAPPRHTQHDQHRNGNGRKERGRPCRIQKYELVMTSR